MYTTHKNSYIYIPILILLLTSFLSLSLTGCTLSKASNTDYLEKQNYVLGTIVSIKLYDHQSDEILNNAFNKLSELEMTLSINKDNTLIDAINESAGLSPIKVDSATFNLIEKSLYYSELTSGAFDITIGPIVKLWNIGFPSARVPSQEEINEKLPLVNHDCVILNPDAKTVYLEYKGMQLDLGGIGKGYAADVIATLLRNSGVEHAIINIGGNIYALGDKPDNKPWNISIQNPFDTRGTIIGTLQLTNKSIVTSGIYERYFTDEYGAIYHHLLDPKTGYPFKNELASVTIISDSSTDGDALSTSTFALGVEAGIDFIENLEGIDAIFVTTDKKIYLTSGIKNNFILSNTSFEMLN